MVLFLPCSYCRRNSAGVVGAPYAACGILLGTFVALAAPVVALVVALVVTFVVVLVVALMAGANMD